MKEFHFVFVTDNLFVIPTTVAIHSLKDSQYIIDKKYIVHVLCNGLSENDKEIMISMTDASFTVDIIDITEKFNAMRLSKLQEHYCTAKVVALLKFEIANVLEDVDKVLYLDGDIVVKGDLSELFDIYLGEAYVAGVRDCGVATYARDRHQNLELNFDNYINSGVMLLNLKKMREDNLREELYRIKFSLSDKTKMDQNVFNIVFAKNEEGIKLLPLRYNCTFINDYLENLYGKVDLDILNDVHCSSYSSWEQVLEDAVILHYSAPLKPWLYSDTIAVEYWDRNFNNCTSLKNIQLKRKKIHILWLASHCKNKYSVLLSKGIVSLETKGLKRTLKIMFRKYFSVN